MVGLALEVHETSKLKKQLKQAKSTDSDENSKTDLRETELALQYQGVNPNFLDVFHYGFCYIGVLTGDFFQPVICDTLSSPNYYFNRPIL